MIIYGITSANTDFRDGTTQKNAEWPASVDLPPLTPTPHASSVHSGKEICMAEPVKVLCEAS